MEKTGADMADAPNKFASSKNAFIGIILVGIAALSWSTGGYLPVL